MVDSSGDRWLSVSEAARQLAVSRQALHHRIKRGTLDSRKGNRGQTLVRIPSTVAVLVPDGTIASSPSMVDDAEPRLAAPHAPESVPLSLHREAVEALQAALATARADMETERERHTAEIERLVGQVHAERSFWIERADAAEVRAEAAEQRLADSRRPWWSRLLGASRRSDIKGGGQ